MNFNTRNTSLVRRFRATLICILVTVAVQAAETEASLQAVADLSKHPRVIEHHPRWLQTAFRPAFAHFEWDPAMTAEVWARRAATAGADSLFGVGEMPAGTVDGKIRTFKSGELPRDPAFHFPGNYVLDYRWVKSMADAAHAQGLRCVIYDGSFRSLDPILVEHPDWRQKTVTGTWFEKGFGSWYSPYRQAFIDRWAKVAAASGVDGVMVDMLFTAPLGGDYSPYTVAAFEKRYGCKAPQRGEVDTMAAKKWIEFQSWTREEVALELTETLHRVNPEFAVVINQTRGWLFQGRDRFFLSSRVAACCDGLLEEQGWEIKRLATDHPWDWPTSRVFQNLFLRSRTEPGYAQMWHLSMDTGPVEQECSAFSMLANGVAPGVVVGGNWRIEKNIWRETKDCEPWIYDSTLLPWLGFHFSEATLKWYANGGGPARQEAYMENLFGVFQALLELHYPVRIVTDDDLENPAALARISVLVLPNSACMSARQADAVSAFVKKGGGLVGTYETGLFDGYGTRRAQPVLANVFGANRGEPVASRHLSIQIDNNLKTLLHRSDLQEWAAARQGFGEREHSIVLFDTSERRTIGVVPLGAPSAGTLAISLRSEEPDQPTATAATTGTDTAIRAEKDAPKEMRAAVVTTVGQGKAVYFPFDIGHAFFVYGQPATRALIGGAIEAVARQPVPLRTSAPMCVQVVGYQRGHDMVVHLVNDVSTFGRAAAPNPEAYTAFRTEVLPIFGITVEVRGVYSRVLLFPENRELPVTVDGDFTKVTVPRLEIHQMLAFIAR